MTDHDGLESVITIVWNAQILAGPRHSLCDGVYALVAYILAQNKLIDANLTIDRQSLPKVQMPSSHSALS